MIKKTMNWPILIRRLERGGTFFVESFNIYEPPKFSYLQSLNFPISIFLSPILLRTSILIIFLIMSSSFLIFCIRDFLQIYSRMRYIFQLTMIRLFSYSSILIEDRSLSNTELTFSIVGGTILKTIMPTLPFS